MSYNFLYGNMIANLRNAIIKNKFFLKQNNTRAIRKILKFLKKERLILGYYVNRNSKRKIIILIKYLKKVSILKIIKVISKPSNHVFMPFTFFLTTFIKRKTILYFISSSTSGYITNAGILKNRTGGKIILEINQ